MTHLFILNSFAGTKDATPELKAEIEALGMDDAVIEFTQSEGDAAHIARRWAEKGFILYEKLANFLQSLRLVGRGWIFMDDIVTDLANSYSNLE
jgi:hypothetical protein